MKKIIALLVILYGSLLFSFGSLLQYASYTQLLKENVTSQPTNSTHKFICSTHNAGNYFDHIADPIKIKLDGANSNGFKHNSHLLFEKLFENSISRPSSTTLFLIYNNLRI